VSSNHDHINNSIGDSLFGQDSGLLQRSMITVVVLCVLSFVAYAMMPWNPSPPSDFEPVQLDVDDTITTILNNATLGNLRPSDLPGAADCAASAFVNSPMYSWILQGMDTYKKKHSLLDWLFLRNFQLMYDVNPACLFGLRDETGRIVCSFMIAPPGNKVTLPQMIRYGLLALPIKFGWTALKRMLSAKDITDAASDRYAEQHGLPSHHWELQRMVVNPEFQGRGFGSKCLSVALQSLVKPSGLPCVLNTQEARNVTFYQRLGFKVIGEFDACDTHIWCMAWDGQ
jgi:ribosomal protein S18 acetylase RimI-like enzyme